MKQRDPRGVAHFRLIDVYAAVISSVVYDLKDDEEVRGSETRIDLDNMF